MNLNIKKWYVIQVFSGSENKVYKNILNNIKINNFNDFFGKIIIPKEEIIEIKFGNKKKSERKFFPGYILIEMLMNNITLNFIKKIPNVIGFIGSNRNYPSYVKDNEIKFILNKIKECNKEPIHKFNFNKGEKIKINDGPFSGFYGIIENIDYFKNKLIISIIIFNRSTPVELYFNQIEKYKL